VEKPIAFCSGRVSYVGSATSKSGRAYTVVSVELAARQYNGKTYRNRAEVHDFLMKTEVKVGDWVSAAGDCSAEVEQSRDNRSYGKLVIVGRLTKLDVPVPEVTTETNEEGASDEPA
jgi:hypothetical protein